MTRKAHTMLLSLLALMTLEARSITIARPTYCNVAVTARKAWPDRRVTIMLDPACPAGGKAVVMFTSKLQNQNLYGDLEKGLVINKGEVYHKRMLKHWYLKRLTNAGTWIYVPERW